MRRSYRRAIVLATATLTWAAGLAICTSTPSAYAAQTCHGKKVTMVVSKSSQFEGTEGDDVVLVTGTHMSFDGLGGDDTICVTSHNVSIFGGPGNDWISAAKATHDVGLWGGTGNDTLIGSPSDDVLYGDAGKDTVRGGKGDDSIFVGSLDGTSDTKTTAADVDAGPGNDQIEVDLRFAAAAGQQIAGGPGKDLLRYDSVHTAARIDVASGTITTPAKTNTITGLQIFDLAGKLDFRGTDHADDVRFTHGQATIRTYSGNDRIDVNNTKINSLQAGSGNDRVTLELVRKDTGPIKLGAGNDTAVIGERTDAEVQGGSGDDTFKIATELWLWKKPSFIVAKVLGQSGKDTLTWDCKGTAKITKHRLTCAKRDVTVGFGGIQVYRGGPRNDEFRGGTGPDVFYGAGGRDKMYGGKGSDTLIGGKGRDFADGGPGKDTCHAEQQVRC